MSEQVSAVLVPQDESQPLHSILIPKHPNNEGGDLEQMTRDFQHESAAITSIIDIDDIRQKLLIRPSSQGSPGLYAFCVVPAVPDAMKKHPQRPSSSSFVLAKMALKNVRATRLAMACGHFSYQLYGTCLLVRTSLSLREDLEVNDVYGACCISPDLRPLFQQKMLLEKVCDHNQHPSAIPMTWLGDALQQNYHDATVLSRLAAVMTGGTEDDEDSSSDSDSDSDDSTNDQNKSNAIGINAPTNDNLAGADSENDSPTATKTCPKEPFVTKQPLCIHCRRPASTLCEGCQACYFCDSPRNCKILGWTHECLCPTWRTYAHRRKELATFTYLERWTQDLTTIAFHSSDKPYERFLCDKLGIQPTNDDDNTLVSWWSTELHGWAGGNSQSAATVDITIRQSYEQGFAPLKDIPPQRSVNQSDIDMVDSIQSNAVGLVNLTSWEDYYRLRDIPPSSPVALLCTFPLTVYHGIVCYGEVPCTVARMLKRPLRVHIVGVEKEANFLDLFQEVGFLLPQDFSVELTFIVREDMLPPKCRQPHNSSNSSVLMQLQLCPNLSIAVVSGTYGDSLNPNFDCGTTGPPDMVMGMNAGLYAYPTWRSVVDYLEQNEGIVGVFTDYNEYSGLNCASLGGHEGRLSLSMNPFRQPRAMPVYSMNLPQFSNGFFYVMNAQKLE